jgi:putative DNA methylase
MNQPVSDTRLIERWLPIAEIGEESVRERRSMTALPPTYYLHVWWARRPLVASRAAILASILPGDADHEKFKHVIGIHGDPLAAKQRIARADRAGERLGADAYGYKRAFAWIPNEHDREWMSKSLQNSPIVLDPTAGGGSIPFEAVRLGLTTFANDLNPVASLIEYATVKWPAELGMTVKTEFETIGKLFTKEVRNRLEGTFPPEPDPDCRPDAYLWARTIICPYCEGLLPLSPNWRLAPDGTGVRLLPRSEKDANKRRCDFEIVSKLSEHSPGTVAGGDATCPYPDCGRVIDGDEVKRQAQGGLMGQQLFTVVFKRRIATTGKSGKQKIKWMRGYRAPLSTDDNSSAITSRIAEKLPEWEALDTIPSEPVPEGQKTDEQLRYGTKLWRDLFSPRQLLCHATSVEVFSDLLAQYQQTDQLTEVTKAAFAYLCLSLDKMLNYNSRKSIWMSTREVIANTFNRHDYAFCWSHAEMAPLIEGIGYDWAVQQTAKCIEELVELVRPHDERNEDGKTASLFAKGWTPPPITLTCKSADSLDHLINASVDCVVMDPPYYDNVMYAELSDFFYVWLKRTAGLLLPELFRRPLTDKENEAVANPAKFRAQKGAKALAGRDYQDRMAGIFAECRRVLKPDGIMTLMFTHKATGAWDALTKGLMEAGFIITASWPINTEAESSMHIKDKAAANSTIFLACRPRATKLSDAGTQYWEDVEPLVAGAVRKRVAEFQAAGIRGVDLYLASFGPALEEFSKHWPLKRGTPNAIPPSRKRAQKELFPEEWDPYAVSPEDALNAARREVKSWRLEQLTHKRARTELDPRTSWFVLAWDAFQAPVFPYDEALRLARAVGVDLDKDIVGSLANKKGSDLIMWDSVQRANKGALGSADGLSGMIDALHHTAYQGRTKTLESARELLERAGIMDNPNFRAAMQAILEVLPVGTAFSGVELPTDVAGAGNDFEAIEKLRRLAFADQVEEPQQLSLWLPTTT